MPTTLDGVTSFTDFWRHFTACAPEEMVREEDFDAISVAVAGAVQGQSAVLHNIPWNIHVEEIRKFRAFHLLNDFLAQAWACRDSSQVEAMSTVRRGQVNRAVVSADDATGSSTKRAIVIVGAGTGLGHCTLFPDPHRSGAPWFVAGSESGHGSFSFHGRVEREIEELLLEWTGRTWLSNDAVVSGSGAAMLHRALTGRQVTAAEALSRADSPTVALFARFYARACRNYCLAVLPVQTLIISGGIAARNPHLLDSAEFHSEFNDAADYTPIMQSINIRLNLDDSLGIRGAAAYALSRRAGAKTW